MSITTMHARLDKLAAVAPGHVITGFSMHSDPDWIPPPGSFKPTPESTFWLIPDLADSALEENKHGE